jgi:arylformamidase
MADPFRTRDHVPDFDAHVRAFAERSAATRAQLPMLADVPYGPWPEETLDLFFPAPDVASGAVHMFVHGGYWRMFSKNDFSFVAETVTRAGAIAVIIDYALMPAVRMDVIVNQVRRAKSWIRAHIAEYGGDPCRLTVSGHSAGAHLCSLIMGARGVPTGVEAAFLLSGLYDLAPLQSSFLQNEIAITNAEVERFSPLRLPHDPTVRVSLLVGERETTPFHEQAAAFASHLAAQGLAVAASTLADGNHMSVVSDLGAPESNTGRLLASFVTGQCSEVCGTGKGSAGGMCR